MGLVMLECLLAGLFAVDSQSFWLDELGTHRIANVGSLAEWWHQFWSEPSSDRQMPFYHLYVFAWSRLLGLSEHALRSANLPIYATGLVLLAWGLRRRPMLAACVTFVVGLHPLVWYYLNDARPYVLLYMSTAVALAGLLRLYELAPGAEVPPGTLLLFGPAMATLGGASMLGMFWVGTLLTLVALLWRSRQFRCSTLSGRWTIAVSSVLLVGLGIFYALTLLRGIRATAAYATTLRSLGFATYELFGFGGVGPGRSVLRESGASALGEHWLALVAFGAVFGAVTLRGAQSLFRRLGHQAVRDLVVALTTPALLIALVGFQMHWRVVGRHLMPLSTVLALVAAFGLASLLSRRQSRSMVLAGLFAVILVLAALSYRLPRHAKEDYRAASAIAAEQVRAGASVWWFASMYGGDLYGLPIQRFTGKERDCPTIPPPPAAIYPTRLSAECFERLPHPDVIFLTRPKTYDPTQILEAKLQQTGYVPATAPIGFSVWQLSPKAP